MKFQAPRFRNKAMLLCGLLTAGVIAAPGAFARDQHDSRYSGYHDYSSQNRYSGYHDYNSQNWHHHDRDDNIGALVAGALIGGVIVNALDHSHDYSRTYYAPTSGYYNYDAYRSYGNGYGYEGNGPRSTYYSNRYAPPPPPAGYYRGW